MNIVIFNNQGAGDCFLGTWLAQIIKRDIPDAYIIFAISAMQTMLTMSTNEPDKGKSEILEIISLQKDIDAIGIVSSDNQLQIYKENAPTNIDKIYQQSEWWSDLGIVGSMLVPYYKDIKPDFTKEDLDTDITFTIGKERKLPADRILVATAGPLDWNNKLKSEERRQQTLYGISNISEHIQIIPLGADIGDRTYLEALEILNNCHIYVGPEGSMGHLAAGLGLDTICVCGIYPSEWVSPAFYKKTGWHKRIITRPEFHCGDFKCVQEKPYDATKPLGWGNPPSQFSSWPHKCTYMPSGKSCINKINPLDTIGEFRNWFIEHGSRILSQTT